MEWNPYGGKMHEISPSETPFPHRAGNLFLIEYLTSWGQDGVDAVFYHENNGVFFFFPNIPNAHAKSNHSSLASEIIYTPQKNATIIQLHLELARSQQEVQNANLTKASGHHNCSSETHVQATVKCAKSNDIQVRIRSGGHDFEGLSYVSEVNYVVLDMFSLHEVDLDIESGMAWVEAGATLGELNYQIANKSNVHAFPAGVCSSLGTGGHFSGGGYGNLMRKYGLSVDDIIDAKLVNANEDATDVAYKWQLVAPNLDKDLLTRVQPNVVNGTVIVSFIGQFLGPIKRLVPLEPPSIYFKSKSDFVETPIPKEALKSIWDLMIKYNNIWMQWSPYGGRMAEISPQATTFPHRAGNLFLIQYSVLD
ncbi:Berberine bridge enzyme-like 17 [Glycine max]|nr:Berberine bridge enzyme-like 17 [Glycine max]